MAKAEIIYEDNHLIVINKPAGFLVQGDQTGDEPVLEVLKRYIKETYNKPGNVFLAPNHRLDRPVSGVLIFSKTSKALSRINRLFQEDKVAKKYMAIVEGIPDELEGELVHYIAKNREKNISYISRKKNRHAKKSILRYRVLKMINQRSLVEVYPKTGRSHQIRVQLASLGTPIAGDFKYGAKTSMDQKGTIGLHCLEMSLIHPVQKTKVTFVADLPASQIWRIFEE